MTGNPVMPIIGAVRVMIDDSAMAPGVWPPAATFVLRVAIESAVDRFWELDDKGMLDASWKDKFLCMSHGKSPVAGRRLHLLWETLSQRCHRSSYDLPPTAGELEGWIAEAEAATSLLFA